MRPSGLLVLPSGKCNKFAVLDLDKKNGKDGFASLRALGYEPNDMSPATICTPSGGKHIYFAHREGLRCSAGRIGVGVDVRADGGYVIAPGAVNASGA